jgi:hypothetical protein
LNHRSLITWASLLSCAGCSYLPEISRQPTVHNPFPQLSKVAVAPFFNLSAEATIDGRQFALAYFHELQSLPGFEVVAVGTVEEAMREYRIRLDSPADARKLAQILDVDAVVVGAVTDYTPYYPPRCGLHVEWYAANPCFHPIPPGYGLPWGTPEEEQIPQSLIFEAEMALARAQMATQTPANPSGAAQGESTESARDDSQESARGPLGREISLVRTAQAEESDVSGEPEAGEVLEAQAGAAPAGLPPDWPDPSGFTPAAPSAARPTCRPSDRPVLTHTRTFSGADGEFTTALESYVYFRNDARSGGWQSYLRRSDDFIRFCCHLHLAEMLTARGGAGESRVVWRWRTDR